MKNNLIQNKIIIKRNQLCESYISLQGEVYMETVITNKKIKEKCQIFTPNSIVKKMLDISGYSNHVFGKRVLENSCGDGQILVEIVKRYIIDGLKQKLTISTIKKGLEQDIVALDIDPKLINKSKKRLTNIAAEYSIFNVNWNIKKHDFITFKMNVKYDYIIGNPPYIAYPNLPEPIRKYVRENYSSCQKGKFDYSYAFVEKSYKLLKDSGVLVYIIPSNIFKNVFASSLRNLIKTDLTLIYDFPNDQIFTDVLVSPAIIKVCKNSNSQHMQYIQEYQGKQTKKTINKNSFSEKWVFDIQSAQGGNKVGDYFRVSSSVATLLNEAFIIRDCSFDEKFCYIEDKKIEKAILRKAASPKNKKYKKYNEYIIFPYYFGSNGELKHYTEREMLNKFPFAIQYLSQFKEKLNERKSDKTAAWYEYGRSQALQNVNQEMILLSSVISECTKAYMLDKEEIPYSGLYIIPKGEIALQKLIKQLNSSAFIDHILKVGVCVSGKSKRITPSDVENFTCSFD